MALPSTNLGMGDINVEIDRSRTSQISLDSAESGDYVSINTNSEDRPNTGRPAAISEWIGYNHDAVGSLEISPTSRSVGSSSTSFTLNITTSTSWTYSNNDLWISTNTSSGFGNSTMLITVQTNFNPSSRFGTVSISSGGITRNCIITQAGNPGGLGGGIRK